MYLKNRLFHVKQIVVGKNKTKIILSGQTGFLGSHLTSFYNDLNVEVVGLTRKDFLLGPAELAAKLEGALAVIHLAGAPIIGRWTASYKKEVYESRILTTRKLVSAMELLKQKPDVFLCASAVGIYPDEGRHDENSAAVGDGFLGKVTADWEREAAKAGEICRTVMLRFGIMLGKSGGALKKMSLPFKFGVGGRIGSGKQMMSWIHIEDVMSAIHFAITQPEINGPLNVSSPNPTSNREFTKTLARVMRRPAIFPVPAFMLRLVFGQGAVVLTGGQTALPKKLQDSGFVFKFPNLEPALRDLL